MNIERRYQRIAKRKIVMRKILKKEKRKRENLLIKEKEPPKKNIPKKKKPKEKNYTKTLNTQRNRNRYEKYDMQLGIRKTRKK